MKYFSCIAVCCAMFIGGCKINDCNDGNCNDNTNIVTNSTTVIDVDKDAENEFEKTDNYKPWWLPY